MCVARSLVVTTFDSKFSVTRRLWGGTVAASTGPALLLRACREESDASMAVKRDEDATPTTSASTGLLNGKLTVTPFSGMAILGLLDSGQLLLNGGTAGQKGKRGGWIEWGGGGGVCVLELQNVLLPHCEFKAITYSTPGNKGAKHCANK